MKRLFLGLTLLSLLAACSSNPHRNDEFERSQETHIDISNAHVAQRDIDSFAKFSFKKEDFAEAVDYLVKMSKKSEQFRVWKDSLVPLKAELNRLNQPGHVQFDTGFHGRTTAVGWLIDKGKGTVCCVDRKPVSVKELKLEEASDKQKKTHSQFTADKMKYEKYYKLPNGDRIWPWLRFKDNAFGE